MIGGKKSVKRLRMNERRVEPLPGLSTGTPLIGRFLGPRKNRLNRNPSY